MKKLTLLILVAAALFAGCNNLTVEKNKDSKSGNVTINIANQSRTISPMSGVSLDKFEEWKITFIDQNGFIDEFSVNGIKDNLVFTVPAGIYTVTVESSYTPPVPADGGSVAELKLTGSKTDVEIGEYTRVNISVGLAKESTGDFYYTLTGDVSSGYVSLVNMKKGGTSYSAEIQEEGTSEETSEESPLKAVYNDNGLVVTGTGLKSGFYKLYVTDTPVVGVDNTDAVIYYDIGDFLVEIADGLTTTGSASSVSESQTLAIYYGTNDKETGFNGKFPFARKNVNDILQLLITNKKWHYAAIYMNTDVPELDVVVINQLRDTMIAGNRSESGDGYYVKIIGSEAVTFDLYATKDEDSGDWTSYFKVTGAKKLSLNADSADESTGVSEKKLVIDSFEIRDGFVTNLILKDGVTVATSSTNGISQKQLTVELNNYNTYEKTPFLVYSDVESIPEMSIVFANESYIAAQKTVSDDEEGPYTISWYARVACPNEVVANEAIPEFTIKTSAGTETDGVTTIPVAADTKIVFETETESEELDDSYTYTWYLTGDSSTLLSIDPVYIVEPTRDESFPVEGTIACVVSDSAGNWGSAVFQFVLTASQSPIILYNNKTSDAGSDFTLGLAAFDEIITGQTIGTFLHDGAIRDFCFDGNCNLYVVTGASIVKYAYSLFKGYSSDNMDSLTDAKSEINAVSCDTTNEYIFYLSGGTVYVYDPSSGTTYTLDDVSVNEEVYNLFSPTAGVTYSYEAAIKNIAASNGALYIAMDVTQTGDEVTETAQIIARYTYKESGGSITLTWNGYVAAGASDVFGDTSTVAVTVNDMMVQDSNLYVLVSQKEGSSFTSLTHRGALLTITDDNVSLSLTSIDGANTAAYATGALDADTFYAPQKFLAVMPKKLIIADEGYWISNKKSPYDNSGFVNRVVTVDLDGTESPKAVEVGVSFDLSISIDGTAPDCTIYY